MAKKTARGFIYHMAKKMGETSYTIMQRKLFRKLPAGGLIYHMAKKTVITLTNFRRAEDTSITFNLINKMAIESCKEEMNLMESQRKTVRETDRDIE